MGAEPGQLSYAGQRDIPYHLASCKNKQTNKQKTTKKTMVTVVLVLPWASFSFSVMVVLESLVGKYFVY